MTFLLTWLMVMGLTVVILGVIYATAIGFGWLLDHCPAWLGCGLVFLGVTAFVALYMTTQNNSALNHTPKRSCIPAPCPPCPLSRWPGGVISGDPGSITATEPQITAKIERLIQSQHPPDSLHQASSPAP